MRRCRLGHRRKSKGAAAGGLGIETGVDLRALADTGRWLAQLLGRETGSKVGKALAAA